MKHSFFLYSVLFLIGINLMIYFSFYGFMFAYDYNKPIFSSRIDQFLFIIIALVMTYFSSTLTFWGYFGLFKSKTNISMNPLKKSLELTNRYKFFFIFVIIIGFLFLGLYNREGISLGVFFLITILIYASIYSIFTLITVFKANYEYLDKNFSYIIKTNKNFIFVNLLVFQVIILFIFLFITTGLEMIKFFILQIKSNYDYVIPLFLFLYYPVFIFYSIFIFLKKQNRLAIDFLFFDRLIKFEDNRKIRTDRLP